MLSPSSREREIRRPDGEIVFERGMRRRILGMFLFILAPMMALVIDRAPGERAAYQAQFVGLVLAGAGVLAMVMGTRLTLNLESREYIRTGGLPGVNLSEMGSFDEAVRVELRREVRTAPFTPVRPEVWVLYMTRGDGHPVLELTSYGWKSVVSHQDNRDAALDHGKRLAEELSLPFLDASRRGLLAHPPPNLCDAPPDVHMTLGYVLVSSTTSSVMEWVRISNGQLRYGTTKNNEEVPRDAILLERIKGLDLCADRTGTRLRIQSENPAEFFELGHNLSPSTRHWLQGWIHLMIWESRAHRPGSIQNV